MSLPVFWGLQLSPGQTQSPKIEHHVRITTASFGKKVQKDSRSTVYLKIADKEFAVCNLSESKIESISCDIVIPIESEPSFRITGNNTVYLTGQILHPQEEEEEDSDSEDDAIRQLLVGEDLSDDDDDASFDGEDSDEDLPEGEDMDDDSEESDEDDKILEQHLQKLLKKNSKSSDKKEIPAATKKVEQPKKVEAPQESKKSKKDDTPVKLTNGVAKPSKNDKKPEVSKPAETNGKRKNETEAPKNKKNKPEVKAPAKVEKKEEPKTTIKTLPSGLKIEDRLVGTGAEAKRNNRVLVRYIGRLKNGKVFDQNSSGAPFCFRLGVGEVIKGWDQGVAGMRVGGQRKLTIPAPLAYGSRGAPPDIPKNAELNFEIKLMGIK